MIIKVRKTGDYAAIRNATLCDKRLSFRARGILAYLLSKPVNWQVSTQDLINQEQEGRDAIRACFKEMKGIGYAILEPVAGGGSQWIICEQPESRAPEKPSLGAPEKPDALKNAPNKERKKSTKKDSASPEVVNIYEAYPRKVGRPAALRAITKALKTTPAETLLNHTKMFASTVNGSDPQFIPHPRTWFNQERYNDDPSTWKRHAHKTTPGPSVINASNSNADRASDY